ncbi:MULTISPECIES: SusC/RagA family TonB-linked outer membrane protein [Sphingobacterium]|uniref:SusC/RagA family TonB-linked outer membrane protein n=1 Tax=Sphingobacterium TaxID=28453 RepID=UPI00257FB6EC|nr:MULTISPECIES: SusC/RagA family TonB-linked outer membrane protein [Sphingobacterium]
MLEVKKKTGYDFLYNSKALKNSKPVYVQLSNVSLETALDEIVKGQNLAYKIKGSNVIISEKKNSNFFGEVQVREISGIVKDQKGVPIVGANVSEFEKQHNQVRTDDEGRFRIKVSQNSTRLLISNVGYKKEIVFLSSGSFVNITLNIEVSGLDEVVVIGYGTQRKRDVTGSVQNVKIEGSPMADLPFANPLLALSSTVPGIQVAPQSLAGQDPLSSMSIRGENSIDKNATGLNKPLLVVDGIIFNGSINEINFQDVASIDVLKDASAAAIYGSRSANGVILITTKKGNSEKPLISLNTSYAFQDWSRKPAMQDDADIILKNRWDFLVGRGDIPKDAQFDAFRVLNATEQKAYEQGIFTNWLDEITQFAPVQNYNVSVSGNSKVVNYYLSAGIFDQKGVIMNDRYKKKTFMGKTEVTINPYIKIGTKVNYFDADNSGLRPKMQEATWMSPFSFTTNPTEGYENWIPSHPAGASGSPLIGSALRPGPAYATNELRDRTIDGTGWFEISNPWVKGLKYTFSLNGTSNRGVNNQMFDPRFWVDTRIPERMDNYNKLYLANVSGYAQTADKTTWLLNSILSYTNTFGRHHIDALFGYTRDTYKYELLRANGSGFEMPVTLLWDGLHLAKSQTVSKTQERYQNVGTMGRVSYNFSDRYFFTGTWRRDGFSGFSEGNKFGTFLGASVGWNLTNESFLKQKDWLQLLKLRLSYGETGNQGISPYATLSKVATSYNVYGENSQIDIYPTSMGNKKLTWATTGVQNLGVDFALINNRISGSLDIYKSKTTNQLLTRSIPILTGYSTVLTNAGRVDNKGIEFSLSGRVLDGDGKTALRWEPSFLFSLNRNKLVELYGTFDKNGNPIDDIGGAPGGDAYLVGKSIHSVWDLKMLGIVQQDDSEYIEKYGAKPGDVKFLDYNNDGKINATDRHYLGDRDPLFTMDLNNTLTYKNFSLYFSFKWMAGNDQHFLGKNQFGTMLSTSVSSNAHLRDVTPYTIEQPNNEFPRVNWSNSYSYQFWRDRSFLKLKDIGLSYNVDPQSLSRIKLQRMRVYVSANNVFTATRWNGLDPEDGGIIAAQPGSNYNWSFPVLRTFSFGAAVSF